ncbi:MAG: response regulator [SAR324 cluster bacterium]|nr:response regulator [SAR324 cluster bacterium]
MAAERRKYLRVLFEETITVEAEEWTDPMATGLDISLNGTRFHCENSLSEGDEVVIGFKPDLRLRGVVRWCWPIEWYYQAAVEFLELESSEQADLRDYISGVTGEPYPDYSEEEAEEEESVEDDLEMDDGIDLPDLEEVDDSMFDADALEEDEESDAVIMESYSQGDENRPILTPHSFNGKAIGVMNLPEQHKDVLERYLRERTGFEISHAKNKNSLWPMLKAGRADILLINWNLDGNTSLELLAEVQQKFPGIPVIFLSEPVSLEDRLDALNAGAADFITRPVHMSAIAQSVLRNLALGQAIANIDADSVDADLELPEDFGDDIELSEDLLTDDY